MDILGKYPTEVLRLEGHADERGSAEYNLALGDRRAESVRGFLSSMGVPAAQMNVISFWQGKAGLHRLERRLLAEESAARGGGYYCFRHWGCTAVVCADPYSTAAPADVAQALVPAGSRLVSTLLSVHRRRDESRRGRHECFLARSSRNDIDESPGREWGRPPACSGLVGRLARSSRAGWEPAAGRGPAPLPPTDIRGCPRHVSRAAIMR